MKKFKKSVSMFIVFIMVFGLVVPFASPLEEVMAWTDNLRIVRRLSTPHFDMLSPSLMGVPVLGNLPSARARDSALLRWDISDPGAGGFVGNQISYVLRYFETDGTRIELTVGRVQGTRSLVVNYDVFVRQLATDGTLLGYIHIQDPARSAAVPGFFIYDHVTSPTGMVESVPAETFFNNTDAFDVGEYISSGFRRSPLDIDDNFRRVNNHPRFGTAPPSPVAPITFPITHNVPGFPIGGNTGGPSEAEGVDIDFARLTPSFTIFPNQGFSFIYADRRVHFRWDGDEFLVFFDNTLEQGYIYEFELERYLTPQIYFSEHVANRVWEGATAPYRPTGANARPVIDVSPNRAWSTIRYFTGFDPSDFHVIPFAQNITPAAAAQRRFPHSLATAPIGALFPTETSWPVGTIGHVPPVNINATPAPPLAGTWFDTHPLYINANNRATFGDYSSFESPHVPGPVYPDDFFVRPAAHWNGFEVRFAVPRLFNEEVGRFTLMPSEHPVMQDSDLGAMITMNSTVAPAFDLEVNVYMTLLEYGDPGAILSNVDDRAYPSIDPVRGFRPSRLTPDDEANEIENAFAFFRVTDMLPNVVYDDAFIRLFAPGDGEIGFVTADTDERGTPVADSSSPIFATFMEFDLVDPGPLPGAGVRVDITPFPRPYGDGVYRVYIRRTTLGGTLLGWELAGSSPYPANDPPRVSTLIGTTASLFYDVRVVFVPPDPMPPVFSQIVRYWPVPRLAALAPPTDFTLTNPVLRFQEPGNTDLADFSFTASWLIDTMENFNAFAATLPTGVDIVEIDYMFRLGDIPHWDFPGNHVQYLLVTAHINLSTNEMWFTAVPQQPARPAGTPPIINQIFRIFHPANPDYEIGPDNPISIDGLLELRANLRIETTAAHRDFDPGNISDPGNEGLSLRQYPFVFPGVFFGYVQATEWRRFIGTTLEGTTSFGDIWSSEEASITLDEITQPLPPQPIRLTVEVPEAHLAYIGGNADGRLPENTQPTLEVRYEIPLAELQLYFDLMPEFMPYLSTNLYIGVFEDTIERDFIGAPFLGIDERRDRLPARAQFVPHSYLDAEDDDFPWIFDVYGVSGPSLDVSVMTTMDGRSVRDALRTGVVRIENIPINWTQLASTFLPFGENPDGDDLPPAYVLAEDFNNGIGSINPVVTLNLTGLDENRRHFFFADVIVFPYTPDEDEESDYLYLGEYPDISPFSSLVGATTLGIPGFPDIGEIEPPAPDFFLSRNVTQSSVGVFWPPVEQLPSTTIEYEIVRVQTGSQLSFLNSGDIQRMNIQQVVEALAGQGALNIRGWQTNRQGLLDGPDLLLASGAAPPDGRYSLSTDTFVDEDAGIDTVIIELTDFTLLPNQLYFYYVRTRQVWTMYGEDVVTYSTWLERPVTTYPIRAPYNLREINGFDRFGFDPRHMVFIAWEADLMGEIDDLANLDARALNLIDSFMGTVYMFEYRLRVMGAEWSEPTMMVLNQFLNPDNVTANLDGSFTFRYMYSGLEAGTVYQMQVRLVDLLSGDTSGWAYVLGGGNILTFMTEADQDDIDLEQDVDDWIEFLRRQLEELTRRPFWYAANNPQSAVMVYRPGHVFDGVNRAPAGAPIPLHRPFWYARSHPESGVMMYNALQDRVPPVQPTPWHYIDLTNLTYYLPASVVRDAIEERRGFSVTYSDLEVLLPPGFVSMNPNDAVIEMERLVNQRGNEITDYFVRIEIDRVEIDPINGVPTITNQVAIEVALVATGSAISNIRSWDIQVHRQAMNIVNEWVTSPVMRQNIRNMLLRTLENEELLDYINTIVLAVLDEITHMVADYMTFHEETTHSPNRRRGILYPVELLVSDFDVPIHLIATTAHEDMTVRGYRFHGGNWVHQNLTQLARGPAITTRTPGIFVFAGWAVYILDIEEEARGRAMIGIVARFGLEDFFGMDIDLLEYANRRMIVGSITRMAGAPRNADPMAWAAANLNVTMSSRNAQSLVSLQETIAVVMSLYERRTNTRISSIVIRNHHGTEALRLDRRYAQAVRAAFEIGIVDDSNIQPTETVTIGEFLNMLAALGERIQF